MINFVIKHVGQTNIILCSKRGNNHISNNVENQDSINVFFNKDNNNNIAVAIADGVSSCRLAKEGSAAAVLVVEALFNEAIENRIDLNDLNTIKMFIVRRWKDYIEANWDDYATTLNYLIVTDEHISMGRIGDGTIVVSNGYNGIMSDADEFYSAETFALGEKVLKKSVEIVTYKRDRSKPINAILMTDGIGKELVNNRELDLLDYLCELSNKTEEEIRKELILWLKTLDRKNGDDKSIAILKIKEW